MNQYFVEKVLAKFEDKEEIAVVSPDADGTARAKFFVGLLQDKGTCVAVCCSVLQCVTLPSPNSFDGFWQDKGTCVAV